MRAAFPRISSLLLLALAGLAPSAAQADTVILNHPEGRFAAPKVPLIPARLTDQLPAGAPRIIHVTREATHYLVGRIEGFDAPYDWTADSLPGVPRTLIFRPRFRSNKTLSPAFIRVPLSMVNFIVHEVDHPLDLALIFGDRGYPGSDDWNSSLGHALDPERNWLPGLEASAAATPVRHRGGFVHFLTRDLFQGAASEDEAIERGLDQHTRHRADLSLGIGGSPESAVAMLLQGLAELEHYPDLTRPDLPAAPDSAPPEARRPHQAFELAIKRCLRLLCRLVAVRPDHDLARTDPRNRLHFAGQSARATLLSALESANSARLNPDYDYRYPLDLRTATSTVAESDYFSAADVRRYQSRFESLPEERPGRPKSLPVSPTQQAITALKLIMEEPSWWVIHPEADDSYTLISALVGLAPLTDSGGRLLPDPRNADNDIGAPNFSDPSSSRKALSGKEGLGVRALATLLYDPSAAVPGSLTRAKRDRIRAWAGGGVDYAERVRQAAETFGTHALSLASGGEYGQRLWINRALLFAGQSGSLTAEAAAVRRLISTATQSALPQPGEAKPEGFDPSSADGFEWDVGGASDGTWEAAASGNKAAQNTLRRRRAIDRKLALKTLLALASLGSRDAPASIAQIVVDEFLTLDLRRAQQVATSGEVQLMNVLSSLEENADKGSEEDRLWGLRAKEAGRRINGRISDRLGDARSEMAKAEQRLRRAKNSGTPEEEAEAEAEVAGLFATIQALKRLKR